MKINKSDKLIINELLNNFSSFFNVDFNKIDWSKSIPFSTKKNSMYLNEYKNNYYYRKSFSQAQSEVIYEGIIKINLDHIKLKYDVGSSLRYSHLRFKLSHLSGKIKSFEFKISGYDVEILELFNNSIKFTEKEEVQKIITNYYDVLIATVDKRKYPCPCINGSISFIFDVRNNILSNIRLEEKHTGLIEIQTFTSQSFYRNIISDYIKSLTEFSLEIDLKNMSIISVKLNELGNKNDLFNNLIDVLKDPDVKETVSYLDMINY